MKPDRNQEPKDLRRHLQMQDETCQWPGCRRKPAHSDLNHTHDWHYDGLTTHDNLTHQYPADPALKTETRWRNPHPPDRKTHWTNPTGRTFDTDPATTIQAPRKRPQPRRAAAPPAETKARRPRSDERAPFWVPQSDLT